MTEYQNNASLVKPKLGLLGASMNAMALIAPGAFLWISYQLQAAATAPSGASVASDIWGGIVLALTVFVASYVFQNAKSAWREKKIPDLVVFSVLFTLIIWASIWASNAIYDSYHFML